MKSILKAVFLLLVLPLVIINCNREDEVVPEPTITDVEVGSQNSKVAYAGLDLHFEAKIAAKAKIKSVKLQIIPKSSSTGFIINEDFSEKYAGQINADIHRHYDILTKTKAGEYDLSLVVVDNDGRKVMYNDVFKIENNPDLPSIISPKMMLKGDILNISADVKATQGIEKITFEINKEIYTLDSANYDGKTNYTLDWDLDLSKIPAGHYHPILMIVDKKGNKVSYVPHLDK